jgi:hypothetical protein
MSVSRAVVRLWVFGSVFWIALWGWNDARKCIVAPKGVLFCPLTLDGNTLARTDYLHAAWFLFGPSLLSLAGGLACWWLIARLQNGLEQEEGR